MFFVGIITMQHPYKSYKTPYMSYMVQKNNTFRNIFDGIMPSIFYICLFDQF